MSRPHSANQGPKKIYLANKAKDKNAIPQEYLPAIQYKQQNDYNIKEDGFNEELNLLQIAWDELGITPEYRAVFINLARRVSDSEKKDIFTQEKINLKMFRDSLLNLKKEITNRENNLSLLHSIDKKLETLINIGNNVNSLDNILQEAVNVIKTLRMNAVNIVSKIIKVNQISAYYSNSGKFDTSKINHEYSYDPRYLFKMKDDLSFLGNSTLSTFIEMNNTEIDAFLTNCAPVPNKISNSQKIKIPISDDLMRLITESRYALLQETVLANVDKDDMIYINPKNDYFDGNLRRGSGGKNYRNIEEEKYRYNPNRAFFINNNLNNSAKKKNNNIFQNKNMSKYIYDLKNVNGSTRYNYLFYKNNPKFGNNRLKSAKKKLFKNNYVNPNFNVGKRINIEHDVIESQTHEQFLKKLINYKNPDKNKSKEFNNEDEKMLIEENEVLKEENKKFQDNLNEMKKKIQNLEQNVKEETEKRENLQNKCKELSQREKGYKEQLEKNSKTKKKKEQELNNKIEQLQKEKDKNIKDNKDDKQKYENEKKDMEKKVEELLEKIKDLESKLKSEENEKVKGEKEIEELRNKLKEEKEEREKERLEREKEDREREEKEQKNMEREYEEKKNQEEKNKNLDEEIKRKNDIIKEKEEENQRIILEKSMIEDEKLKLKNDLDLLKEENGKKQEEINRLKEEISNMKEVEEERRKKEEEEQLKKEEEERLKREEEEKKRKEEERKKKEEEERKRKEEEERLRKEEEERRRKEEEEERKRKEEEERRRKEEEEEERKRKEEEERKRKEEEERLKREEEERLKREEEERLKKEKEEKLKKEEEEKKKKDKENVKIEDENLILLNDKLKYNEKEIKKSKEEENKEKEENKENKENKEKEENKEDEENKEKENEVKEEREEKQSDIKDENENEVKEEREEKQSDIIVENEIINKDNIDDKDKLKTKNDIKEDNKNYITPFYNYNVNYYKGNISNLTNQICETLSLERIPDFLKRAFLLNDLIYSDEYYFKGTFPKIIISTEGEGEDLTKIKGLCSFFYENNENLKENLVIRINCIFAIDNYEEQIISMINYIKKNVSYNRIELYLLYDKVDDKFIQNKEAKDLFQKKLDFKWLCVVRDEKQQQRYIKLYFDNEENDERPRYANDIENNFNMNNLTIITVNNEQNAYTLKNLINNRSKENRLNKKSYNKFINPGPIYSLLLDNTRIKKDLNELKAKEIKEMKEKLWRFIELENGWNLIEDEKKKIKDLKIDIKESIYNEVEKYLMSKEITCFCDLCQTNLSTNFESNYSILMDDIYYNRISSDKIKVLKEKRTKSTFFLIPSNDNTTFFYVTEVNRKLKELLIDSTTNIYEKFFEFQPSTQKELFEFSVSSYRDITYIPQTFKKAAKTIYIPAFSINSHLFSYNFKDIDKNVSMTDKASNTKSFLTSVDEFINIEFLPDKNIKNSFTLVPVEGGASDRIIKDSFIIGIFDNDIINEEKLPLLQFLYVTKEHFIKRKSNE